MCRLDQRGVSWWVTQGGIGGRAVLHVLQRGHAASLIRMGDVARVGDVCGCREGVGIPVPVLVVGLPVFRRLVDPIFELASELVGLLGLAFELLELVCPVVPRFELVRELVGFVFISLGSGSVSRVLV